MTTLRVGVAYPVPPFNSMPGDTGLEIELMTALAAALGEPVDFIANRGGDGSDFDAIFDRLGSGDYDCLAAGITVTPAREARATFLPPYLISGQALAVDTGRRPQVHSIDDLDGLSIGVQHGTTGQPVAERLVAEGKAARLCLYDHGDIGTAITDLTTGGCDAVLELGPVLTELVKPLPGVQVVQRHLSVEDIAIAVAPADQALAGRLRVAQAELEDDGTLQRIRRKWLGSPYADQTLGAL
ncbi:MAG: ABC transporter substrate-binding protein [Mycobacterium sp.]|nr:ABC transporter substrate-binding protein [Mycobacterium sp.]